MAKIAKQKHLAKQLGLSKRSLPHSIVEVVGTLQKAGFSAYIVGGGVRDGLLGLVPKDFDAVTDARPHEIKAVFGGRCRIIGKRFLLAHVYSGRELIEVATFRAAPSDESHTTDEGMITRDNVWGAIEQDFERRDFSINALYYDPIKEEILDFCGAIADIKARKLRLLGQANKRIEEDPVRLLRALRFKAKLDFEFDKALASQFNAKNWALLEQVSAHRLYDETQKMFCGGYLSALLPKLYEYGAMPSLVNYPLDTPTPLMMCVAKTTDERVATDQSANPAYFYAVLLWEDYLFQLAKLKKKLPFYEAEQKAATRVIERQRQKTAIPKFAEEFIVGIWQLQPRLVSPTAKDVSLLVKHPRFRAAYDFLVARESVEQSALSEPTNNMGHWWTQYQLFDGKGKAKLVDLLSPKRRSKKQKASKDMTDELSQIQQLTLERHSTDSAPKPLFELSSTKAPKIDTKIDLPVPIFEPKVYTQADFLTLLNNDEPYIPATRYRKRMPSSAFSIKQMQQQAIPPLAIDENVEQPQPKESTIQKPTRYKRTRQSKDK